MKGRRVRQSGARSRQSIAFTLVELLVVITIIGILIALLLPAVQAAREAARRSQCSNNLKQIGLALHNYHDSHRIFPPGNYQDWSATGSRGSVFMRLLPYMEQTPLYQAIDFRTNTDWASAPLGSAVPPGKYFCESVIPPLKCPSDDVPELFDVLGWWGRPVFLTNYDASTGPTGIAGASSPGCGCALGDTYNNMLGGTCGITIKWEGNPSGPFTRSGALYCCMMSAVTDGLSNTIFFGERRPRCSVHAAHPWNWSNGHAMGCTLVPINYDSCHPQNGAAPWADPCNWTCNWNTEMGFKSRHPGGAQFLLGDGSARFIGDTIDFCTYQRLGDKADGQPVTVP